MKLKITISLFFISSLASFGQDSLINRALDSACTCMTRAIDTPEKDTKFDFELLFNDCLDDLFSAAVQSDPSYNDVRKKSDLIHTELKNRCPDFHRIDSVQNVYATHAFESIAAAEDCVILKSGTFVTYGDKDSTKIVMSEKKQLIQFKDGTYTKSKVVWLSACSYKLIRIKSTNDYENQMVKPGEERIINIIHVSQGGTVYYEIITKGKAYSGRLVKIAD